MNLTKIKKTIHTTTKYTFVSIGIISTLLVSVSLIGNSEKVVKLQSPIILRLPFYIEKRPAQLQLKIEYNPKTMQDLKDALERRPKVTPKSYEKTTLNITDIADKIRILESSGGKNDSCLKLGKINGYGFRQNDREHKCFATHTQVRKLVENWIAEKIQILDLPTALCYYNTGYKVKDCEYYQNFLKL